MTLIFSSGALAYLTVDPDNVNVTQILYDKYLIGKLSGQNVTGGKFK